MWGYTLNVGYVLPVMCVLAKAPLGFLIACPGGYINFRIKDANVLKLFFLSRESWMALTYNSFLISRVSKEGRAHALLVGESESDVRA
jgi:hypothetical protein